MTDRHKTPGLSWHPPGELGAWARAEAQRRGVRLSALLTEALTAYRKASERKQQRPRT
jgi:hypothetical protein